MNGVGKALDIGGSDAGNRYPAVLGRVHGMLEFRSVELSNGSLDNEPP